MCVLLMQPCLYIIRKSPLAVISLVNSLYQVSNVLFAVVPIKLVASFNRVKALTADVSVLISAMRMSDLLEVGAVRLTDSMHPKPL